MISHCFPFGRNNRGIPSCVYSAQQVPLLGRRKDPFLAITRNYFRKSNSFRQQDNKILLNFSPTPRPPASCPAATPLKLQMLLSPLNMARRQQSWATICGSAPPELNVRRLQKGDRRFAQTAGLRVATERCFLADGRGLCSNTHVGGSCASFIAVMALYSRLPGSSSCTLAVIYKRMEVYTDILRSNAMLWSHQECKFKSSAVRGYQFVHSNGNMTLSSLKDSLKSQSGCGKLSGRSASHLRKEVLGTGDRK